MLKTFRCKNKMCNYQCVFTISATYNFDVGSNDIKCPFACAERYPGFEEMEQEREHL